MMLNSTKGNKICLVQNLPECLKLPSVYRHKLQADFNESLSQLLALSSSEKGQTAQIVFMFSQSSEITKPFVRRMFSQEILDHPRVA
jgi:hypothetical protein